MKKILFALMGLVVCSGAFGACKPIACGSTSWLDPNGWVRADVGGNQCWFCGPGPNSCGNHDVVPYWDAVEDVVSLYQCSYGLSSTFEKFNPGRFCDSSPLKSDEGLEGVDTTNAKVTYSLTGQDTTPISLGDWNVFTGKASCVFVKCKQGFVPNADKTACVKPEDLCNADEVYADGMCVERKNGCENSGGGWISGNKKCTCDSTKNIENKDDYSCKCRSGYDWNADHSTGCHDVAAANAEKVCRDSGGEWTGSDCTCAQNKNLTLSSGRKCVCINNNYTFDNSSKSCKLNPGVITQDRCGTISGAEWRVDRCICTDANKTLDVSRYECVSPLGYEICKNATGTKWLDGVCVCINSNYRWDGNRCVETDDYVASQNTQKINDLARHIDSKINNLGGELKQWRNIDGSFNTARLASDSIAGVVLGTVGGVVTSSIIKKNQVEDGFEDIKCAIGGQSVASYGDQFSVGLQ